MSLAAVCKYYCLALTTDHSYILLTLAVTACFCSLVVAIGHEWVQCVTLVATVSAIVCRFCCQKDAAWYMHQFPSILCTAGAPVQGRQLDDTQTDVSDRLDRGVSGVSRPDSSGLCAASAGIEEDGDMSVRGR